MYTTAMSVSYSYGFISVIPIMQAFKETMVFLVLFFNIANLKQLPRFHLIDYLILAFLGYMVMLCPSAYWRADPFWVGLCL